MKCPECGHDTDEHGEYGCFHPTGNPMDVECNCDIKKTKLLRIELAAYKAEAESGAFLFLDHAFIKCRACVIAFRLAPGPGAMSLLDPGVK